MSSKDRSSEGSPATEDTLESYEQDEIHRAASVMCDALESLEERRSSATPSRARSRGAERRNGSENTAVKIARAFFMAATVKSGDDEDILPQEDGPDEKLSVYYLFSELFPDQVTNKEGSDGGSKNGLTRLQFNKIGYEMYFKEQSRRVPAPRAKPGNPGYGFKHARWRSPNSGDDNRVCQQMLKPFVSDMSQMRHIIRRIEDFRIMWDACRRPSHPAGPGRGRKTSSNVIAERKRAFEQVRPLHEARASLAFSPMQGGGGGGGGGERRGGCSREGGASCFADSAEDDGVCDAANVLEAKIVETESVVKQQKKHIGDAAGALMHSGGVVVQAKATVVAEAIVVKQEADYFKGGVGGVVRKGQAGAVACSTVEDDADRGSAAAAAATAVAAAAHENPPTRALGVSNVQVCGLVGPDGVDVHSGHNMVVANGMKIGAGLLMGLKEGLTGSRRDEHGTGMGEDRRCTSASCLS